MFDCKFSYFCKRKLVFTRDDGLPTRKRLLSLAAQKFVSDIAADAYQHARIRTNAASGRSRAQLTGPAAARVSLRAANVTLSLTNGPLPW